MHCAASCAHLSVVLRTPLFPGLFQIRPLHTRPRLRCSEPETSTTENDPPPPVESSPDPFGLGSMMEEVKDSRELGSRGEGWTLSIAIACALLMFPPVNLYGLISALGWIGASAGFVLFCYSMISLGKSNFPLPYPRKNAEFVERGIYAHVRHPMYGSILLLGFGLAAISRNETRGALCFLLWGLLERLIRFEEKAMIERFSQYTEYSKRTSKFLPKLY